MKNEQKETNNDNALTHSMYSITYMRIIETHTHAHTHTVEAL